MEDTQTTTAAVTAEAVAPAGQEDLSGLKKALAAERQLSKEAKAALAAATAKIAELEPLGTQVNELTAQLNGYKERETRTSLIAKATEGKRVDAAKVAKLAARLPVEGLEEALAEIVSAIEQPETAATPATPTVPARAISAVPAADPAQAANSTPLGQLYQTNPEAYQAAVAARRSASGNPFLKAI